MKDTKELVLILKENTSYTPIDVAKELSNRYEELGEAIILPTSENKKTPRIIFNNNPDFQIQGNMQTFTIVVRHNYFDVLPSIIFDVVDTLEEFNCNFVRIGYVSSVFLSPKYVKKSQDRFLNMEHIEEIKDMNLSWYRKLPMKYGEINCWERFITDSHNFNDLLCQYDFNSLATEEIKLDMKYIKEFIKYADEYIEKRIDF